MIHIGLETARKESKLLMCCRHLTIAFIAIATCVYLQPLCMLRIVTSTRYMIILAGIIVLIIVFLYTISKHSSCKDSSIYTIHPNENLDKEHELQCISIDLFGKSHFIYNINVSIDNVQSLKAEIYHKTAVPVAKQKLYFSALRLDDDTSILCNIGLTSGATVTLRSTIRGGSNNGTDGTGADASAFQNDDTDMYDGNGSSSSDNTADYLETSAFLQEAFNPPASPSASKRSIDTHQKSPHKQTGHSPKKKAARSKNTSANAKDTETRGSGDDDMQSLPPPPQMQHNTNISNNDPLTMIDDDFYPSKPSPIKFDQSCSIKDEDKQASLLADLRDVFGPGAHYDSREGLVVPPNMFDDDDVAMEGIIKQESGGYAIAPCSRAGINFFSSWPTMSSSSSRTNQSRQVNHTTPPRTRTIQIIQRK